MIISTMKNTNTVTVNVFSNPQGRIVATIEEGIEVHFLKDETPAFSMNIKGKSVLWKDGKRQADIEGGRLVSAGFYIRRKEYVLKEGEYPFFLNIGKPFGFGYGSDVEVLLKIAPKAELEIFSSIDTFENEILDCINFPRDPREFKGEMLLRIPDGYFLRINTKFGAVCLLNVGGQITKHLGDFPNKNTYEKAIEAILWRNFWENSGDKYLDEPEVQ